MDEVRITATVARVLRAFLEDAGIPRYGLEIMEVTGLSSGTLYPILGRLEKAGWLKSQWEDISTTSAGRPARRFYTIVPAAARQARFELTELARQVQPPAQRPHRLRTLRGEA
jgi:PadR family transcriptional regulator PadR